MRTKKQLGVVVIGRNEGERLLRCLASVSRGADAVVYVDSGSLDGSAARARGAGALVVELDSGRPFTAARARNAGFARLEYELPELMWVQFIDGDCELEADWLEAAIRHLTERPDVAVVCGRRRERAPEVSIYNRLIDIEWDRPAGEVDACGGDALVRATSFRGVGGYDASLVAGEDPELCLRIRRAGGRIERLDRDMTRHDAALLRFGQWWRRQVRSGHAYAEAVHHHRHDPERHRVRRLASILLWAGALPLASAFVALTTSVWGLGLLAGLAIPWLGAWRDARERRSPDDAALHATGCVLGKFAELEGVLAFAWNRLVRGRESRLIEYKGPDFESPL
jgi:GT2 family glycosyltransferase